MAQNAPHNKSVQPHDDSTPHDEQTEFIPAPHPVFADMA